MEDLKDHNTVPLLHAENQQLRKELKRIAVWACAAVAIVCGGSFYALYDNHRDLDRLRRSFGKLAVSCAETNELAGAAHQDTIRIQQECDVRCASSDRLVLLQETILNACHDELNSSRDTIKNILKDAVAISGQAGVEFYDLAGRALGAAQGLQDALVVCQDDLVDCGLARERNLALITICTDALFAMDRNYDVGGE